MKKQSLATRLFAYLSIMLLIMVVLIGSFYFVKSSELFHREVEDHTIHEIDTSSKYIEQYVSNLKSTSISLAQSNEIKNFSSQTASRNESEIHEWLETILKSHPDFLSIRLVTKDGRFITTGMEEEMATSDDMMAQKWYQEALAHSNVPVIQSIKNQKNQVVISISQEVKSDTGEHLGVIRLDVDYHELEKYVKELSLGKNGYAFVIQKDGTLIYHPDSEAFESVDKQMSVQDISNSPMDSMVSEDFFVHKIPIENSDWVLVGVSSFSRFKEDSVKLLGVVSIVGVVSLLMCMVGIFVVIRYQLLPVKKLGQVMKRVEDGDTTVRAEHNGAQEFQVLASTFNQMLERIEFLMKEEKEQEALTRIYELKALTSQINPHFLYNTLDTIIWMAEFKDHQKVVDITKALSNYFRLSLNAGEEIVTLRQEIEHVRQYLFIQKERYGDKLEYHIDELDGIPELKLPKIVLQPLVENAIYHGIKESERPGKITITVSKRDAFVDICIADNGVGMKENTTSKKELGGVGLKNIQERLTLFFGESFSMEIQSKPNVYTKVYLHLPLKEEEHVNS